MGFNDGRNDLPTGGFPGLNENPLAPHFRDPAKQDPPKRPWLNLLWALVAVVALVVILLVTTS